MVYIYNGTCAAPAGMGVFKCFLKEEKNFLLQKEENATVQDNVAQVKLDPTFLNYKITEENVCGNRGNCHNVTQSQRDHLFVDDICVSQKTLKLKNPIDLAIKSDHTKLPSLTSNYHTLFTGDVHAFIPKENLSGHVISDFGLDIIKDDSYAPTVSPTQCICSPIVHITPHRAKFHSTTPAEIFLPFTAHVDDNDTITCLCSDTNINEVPKWQELSDYEVCNSYIKVRTTHFSLFTAVLNKHYPQASKMIFAGIGGTLDVPEVPGVQVTFPSSAVKYDIEATIKVMYADGPYDVDHTNPTSYALAAPVVKLGPTGHEFNPDSIEPVEVKLPLPHGKEIMENCGRPYLTLWQSMTAEGQELEWKLLKTNYRFIEDEDKHLYVCFPVAHFTFFRALWSVLDSVVHEAKIGASFFYPNFEFCISFQAFMSEYSSDETFGLCCLCYKRGTTPESIGNYPVFLGSSGLRMVKSGLLQIRIVSNLFVANQDFGEEALVQREFFTGRPFNKQFACKFTGCGAADQNSIGKIYIERVLDNSDTELLFDFVLTKAPSSQEGLQRRNGHGNRDSDVDQQANWERQLSQELASILSIKTEQDLGDDVWENIARELGYTTLEIDMKFKNEDEPFTKLLDDYKKRGGSPNDFISAMYSVGRNANISGYEQRLRDAFPSTSGAEFRDELGGHPGSISPSYTSTSSGVVLPPAPSNNRKRRHTDAPERQVSDAKLMEVAERVQDKWKKLGRTLGLGEDQITEIELDYKDEGVQEQAIKMLHSWRECYPDNGYETLFQALGKINLNTVARQLFSA